MNASLLGLGLLVAYIALVQFARWLYIARPNIVWNSNQGIRTASQLAF